MTEDWRRRWRGSVKGSDTAARLKGNKGKQPRLWMLFYQVHCVARFLPTLQNTLLHQAEHGKLPQINTPPQSVSLIFYCWLQRSLSLAKHHLKATLCACADGKKWPKTGSKVEFFGSDVKVFSQCHVKTSLYLLMCSNLHCQEWWQYSSLSKKTKCFKLTRQKTKPRSLETLKFSSAVYL